MTNSVRLKHRRFVVCLIIGFVANALPSVDVPDRQNYLRLVVHFNDGLICILHRL